MDTKQCRKTLPDELVEKIVLMLPFPSIAKARGLSKFWRARFSPVSTLKDAATQQDAVNFQKRVQEKATNWSTFFPMCLDNYFLCGYDRASRKWVSFPSLSFLPRAFRSASTYHWIEGILLFGIVWEKDTLYVANLLTRSWKRLARLPKLTLTGVRGANSPPLSVWDASSETYKVIYLEIDGDDRSVNLDPFGFGSDNAFGMGAWSAQIYDPKSGVWSTTSLTRYVAICGRPVYLNGVLYMIVERQLCLLLTINVAEGTLEKLQYLTFEGFHLRMMSLYLVVCNGKLHGVVTEPDSPVLVLEVDVEWGELLEVATAPVAVALSEGGVIGIDKSVQPVSDGNCIFFAAARLEPITCTPEEKLPGQMVAYDVVTHEWAVLDFASKMEVGFKVKRRGHGNFEWIPCPCQPGLNPFAEV